MVMNVRNESRLSMSQNRATIKALVIILIHMTHQIDPLLDEFAGELILLKSIPPGIDETDCDPEEEIRLIEILLYDNSSPRLPKELISKNSDAAIESFSPSPIPIKDSDSFMEIDLSFTLNESMPPGIPNDDYDSKVDMLILEELLSNDSLSLPKNDSFDFDIPSSSCPPVKPLDDDEIKPNLGILTVKVGDHRKVQLNELNELRDQAYENSLIYKEKTKRLHDSKIKDRIFSVSDRVLLFNSRLKIFSGKLKTRWSGPFTITQVFPYGTVELSQTDGPNFKVNGHRLKHYFGEDIPKMVVTDLQISPRTKYSRIGSS
nr:reverse transcriptase domain-containing protein [Tanacetum cinerariifolium]